MRTERPASVMTTSRAGVSTSTTPPSSSGARLIVSVRLADLPVELPTKVEFLINLRVAKTLGIEVPLSLLIRADELLE